MSGFSSNETSTLMVRLVGTLKIFLPCQELRCLKLAVDAGLRECHLGLKFTEDKGCGLSSSYNLIRFAAYLFIPPSASAAMASGS